MHLLANREDRILTTSAPAGEYKGVAPLPQDGLQVRIQIKAAIDPVAVAEELELLPDQRLPVGEVLHMGRPKVGQHSHRRQYDPLEPIHLARSRDARLDEGEVGIVADAPEGERYADGRVVATRGASHVSHPSDHLIEQLLDGRFAITPRDADDRHRQPVAVEGAHLLQGGEGVRHHDEGGISELIGREVPVRYDKGTHPPAVEWLDVSVSVLLLGDESKEKCPLGEGERPGVGQEGGDHTAVPDHRAPQCRSYIGDCY